MYRLVFNLSGKYSVKPFVETGTTLQRRCAFIHGYYRTVNEYTDSVTMN